jgi:FtsZ-binding cell division protein ZapB
MTILEFDEAIGMYCEIFEDCGVPCIHSCTDCSIYKIVTAIVKRLEEKNLFSDSNSTITNLKLEINELKWKLKTIMGFEPQLKADEFIPDDKEDAYLMGYKDALIDVKSVLGKL